MSTLHAFNVGLQQFNVVEQQLVLATENGGVAKANGYGCCRPCDRTAASEEERRMVAVSGGRRGV
jgi:hypothetical protein